MVFHGRVYDVLKFIAMILLPALGTLYFALASIWGLPAAEQVNGSVLAVDAFLGVLLGLSSVSYNKSDARYDGNITVHENQETGTKTFSLNLNGDPQELQKQSQVLFKVE